MKRPAFQFYPADWRKDVELRSCSIAARGLWIDMLCIAHECEPYGHLTINGKPMNHAQIAGQVGLTKPQCVALLNELAENGVARSTTDGTIFSKRMVDDERLRNIRAEAGKLGGNPALLGDKVNQKPTTRDNQKPTPSSSLSSSSSALAEKKSRKRSVAPEVSRPDDVSEQTWADWRLLRKTKGATVSPTVVAEAIAEAAKAGMPLERFLSIWCLRGSQGLQAEWLRPDEKSTGETAWQRSQRERVAEIHPALARSAPGQSQPNPMETLDGLVRIAG